jgi:hypothetical protein
MIFECANLQQVDVGLPQKRSRRLQVRGFNGEVGLLREHYSGVGLPDIGDRSPVVGRMGSRRVTVTWVVLGDAILMQSTLQCCPTSH